MTRAFFAKVIRNGIVETRKHVYKRIMENGLIKIIRDNVEVVAVYVA